MKIETLYEKITGESNPKFLTEREKILLSKCRTIITDLEDRIVENIEKNENNKLSPTLQKKYDQLWGGQKE